MRFKFVTFLLLIGVLLLVLPVAASAKVSMTSTYKCNLKSVNSSGASGQATLVSRMQAGGLRVNFNVWGLEWADDKPHSAAITGFADGRTAKLPTPLADTNHDGIISGSEVAACMGSPLVWLEPWKVTKHGRVVFCRTLRPDELAALDLADTPLQTRGIVVYGVTQQPSYSMPFYDPDAPAAAGLIRTLGR